MHLIKIISFMTHILLTSMIYGRTYLKPERLYHLTYMGNG